MAPLEKRKQRKEKRKAIFKKMASEGFSQPEGKYKNGACGYSIRMAPIWKEGEKKKMVASTSFSKGVGGQEDGICLLLLLESIPAGPCRSNQDVKISK